MDQPQGSQARTVFFQSLKPCCVGISQLAIRESGNPAATRELSTKVRDLLALLNAQLQRNPSVFDEKLAEYIFFPLSQVFRQLDKYPPLVIEDCVRCLTILIVHGWKSRASPKLVQQLLSLLVFIIDGVPGAKTEREIPEETVLESFRALNALFVTAGVSSVASSGLTESESIPALGHGITVILDHVLEGASPMIQTEALRSLDGVYQAIRDQAALASFLPGTVSTLTKLLCAPSRYKNTIVVKALGVFQNVLVRVLGDMRTRTITNSNHSADEEAAKGPSSSLTPAWLKATTDQVKLALSKVTNLRNHDDQDVQSALRRLCVTLLDECHTTLSNSTGFLVETAMALDEADVKSMGIETSLENLVGIYPELGEIVKTAVYSWMSSLPRVMQKNDESVKAKAIQDLSRGLDLVRRLRLESSVLEDSMAFSLRDSLMLLAQDSKLSSGPNTTIRLLEDSNRAQLSSEQLQYQPVVLAHEGQRQVRKSFHLLVKTVASSDQQLHIASNLLDQLQSSEAAAQVASFWLCFELIKASKASSDEVNEFLDLAALGSSAEEAEALFSDLYAFAVQVLDSYSETDLADWRLEAIALEVVAYAAEGARVSFRPELIDVLFPLAAFLGSENPQLQQHAIATLNKVAHACQYESVSQLIIDNVDYMINSVALRLNSLDISPASTQVLTMMIRLAGPRLIPYLDDVVESIVAALDNYHGYPTFVESLFSVLREAVDQGVRSDMLLIEAQKTSAVNHRKRPAPCEGLELLISDLQERQRAKTLEDDVESIQGHPEKPWDSDEKDEEESGDNMQVDREEEKPPNSPTYQLLLRITYLTQHYLTSPTPKLRRSLLELLATASTALAADEDTFLPLVNAVWPVVIDRLHDPETFITVEACHALSGLCQAAGDFLSSRFKTEWWDGLGDWCRRVKRQASDGRRRVVQNSTQSPDIRVPGRMDAEQGIAGNELVRSEPSGSLGHHASPIRVWEAVIRLLTSIVEYVRVDDDMFDEILDLLSDVMERNEEVLEALRTINSDAVWLVRHEKGLEICPEPPPVEGLNLVEIATV